MDRLIAMRAFACVIDTGLLSAAVCTLKIGQLSVSEVMAQLELLTCGPFLLRSNIGLMPTDAGEIFYQGERRTAEEAGQAGVAGKGAGLGFFGRLRIAAVFISVPQYGLRNFKPFLLLYLNLKNELVQDERSVDFVEEWSSSATRRKIARTPQLSVATSEYFKDDGSPTTPAEASNESGVVHVQSGGGKEGIVNRLGVELTVCLYDASQCARAAVRGDVVLSISSGWIIAHELRAGEAFRMAPERLLSSTDIWADFPTRRLAYAPTSVFVAYLTRTFNASVEENCDSVLEIKEWRPANRSFFHDRRY